MNILQMIGHQSIDLGFRDEDFDLRNMFQDSQFVTGDDNDDIYNNPGYEAEDEDSHGFRGYQSHDSSSDQSEDFIDNETTPLLSKHDQQVKRDLAKLNDQKDEDFPLFWDFSDLSATAPPFVDGEWSDEEPLSNQIDQELNSIELKEGVKGILEQFDSREDAQNLFQNLEDTFPDQINQLIKQNLDQIMAKPDDIRTQPRKSLKFKNPYLRAWNIYVKSFQEGKPMTPQKVDDFIKKEDKIRERRKKGIKPLKWCYQTCANICFDCDKIIKTNRHGYGFGLSGIKMYWCLKCYISRAVKNKQKTPLNWEIIFKKAIGFKNYERIQLNRELLYKEKLHSKLEQRLTTELIIVDPEQDDEFIPEIMQEPIEYDCPLFSDTNPFIDHNDNIETAIEQQQEFDKKKNTNPFLEELEQHNQKSLQQELSETIEMLNLADDVSKKADQLSAFAHDPFRPSQNGVYQGF